MTPAVSRCLAAIQVFYAVNGYGPTTEELAPLLGCAAATAQRYVAGLSVAGRVRMVEGAAIPEIQPIARNGATPSVTAAAWAVCDAWRQNRLTGVEIGKLLAALDPETFA